MVYIQRTNSGVVLQKRTPPRHPSSPSCQIPAFLFITFPLRHRDSTPLPRLRKTATRASSTTCNVKLQPFALAKLRPRRPANGRRRITPSILYQDAPSNTDVVRLQE